MNHPQSAPKNTTGCAAPRLAFLLSGFPRISETFILHELLQLQKQGLAFTIFALKTGDDKNVQPEVSRLKAPVIYLPERITISTMVKGVKVLAAGVGTSRRQRIKTLLVFCSSPQKERHFSGWQTVWRWLWLCAELSKRRISSLHAHFAHDPATLALWAHRLTGISFSFTAHARDIYCYPEALLREKIAAADFVVTCTEHNYRHLCRVSPNGTPIHRLYHGLDARKFSTGNAQKQRPAVLLSVGRLVEKKGFPDLLKACGILRERGVRFLCKIIGEGPDRSALEEEIRRLQLQDTVQLEGAMTHKHLLQYYRQATLFVLPCLVTAAGDRDGIPNVILEAMAAQLPIVSTTISGIPEAVTDGVNGVLVEERNPAALANALQELLENPEKVRDMGRAGRERVCRQFSLQHNIRTLKELLQTC